MGNRGRRAQPRDAAAVAVMARLRAQPGMVAMLAAELKISRVAVWAWKVVPLERVVEVERITKVPRETLRPDFHLPVLDLARRVKVA